MIHLTYSNRLEALLDRLAEAVRTERAQRGPWEPFLLVVPNPHLKEYLRIQLARRLGAMANVTFSYLEGAWRTLMPGVAFQLLNAERLQGALLSVFADDAFMGRPLLASARHYLLGDTDGLKAVQLSAELAALFEEYARSRPDWIPAWRDDRSRSDDPREPWQRALWREAVARLDATGRPHLVLAEALAHPEFAKGRTLPPSMHLFGLTHVAQVYHDAYTRLGELTDLHLYALNPCGEFWEDLTTRGEALWEKRRPSRRDARQGCLREDAGDGLDDVYRLSAEGPEALRRWGRPGRENIRLLNDVTDCDFEPCFEDPGDATVLQRIQGDILRFQDPAPASRCPADGSVRFVACPSPLREAEVVASAVWDLLEATPGLGFSDIAVLVPPAQEETYLAHLQAAFTGTRRIPWTRGDGATTSLAQTLEAAGLLLELPTTGFTRAAVLRILSHPALRQALGGLDAATWTRWCDTLGIVRGVDREDWKDTYVDQDALNWDQGLRRLALGAFMGEGEALTVDGQSYPVLNAADAESAGRFLALARGLLAEARALGRRRADLAGWAGLLEAYLERWLMGDDEPVARAVTRIRTFLRRLLEAAPAGLATPAMPYAAARHLALEMLERLRNEAPSTLLRGVVVSSYAPMRAIPCRAVFLMGLGEGVFPGRDARRPLDLRAQGRRRGDVSQGEKDRYLFLETLLSARDTLICSYVARDELSGETLEPGSLFKECQALAERYVDGGLLETHPLRRFDPRYFPEWFGGKAGPRVHAPIARQEARALWLRRDLLQAGPVAMPRALGELGAPPELQARLESWLAHPGRGALAPPEPLLRLTLDELRGFLECPLSGAARVRLGLRKGQTQDLAGREDEPFATAFLDAHGLLRSVTLEAARQGLDPGKVYDTAVQELRQRAAAPLGVFGEREKDENLKAIRGWLQGLEGAQPASWRLGPGRNPKARADRSLPPIRLEIRVGTRDLTVELGGDLQPQLPGASLLLESGAPRKEGFASYRKKALRAYLDHLALACLGEPPVPREARLLFGEGGAFTFTFPPVGKAEAEAILGTWVVDLLTGDHAVLLPIEAVLAAEDPLQITPRAIREFVKDRLDMDGDKGGSFSTLYGPVPDPTRFPPPGDPGALVRRRLGAFLAQTAPQEAPK
ncbi:exodeoxyribonuclease V subunit gamma [Mesoterricola silvestris]|uniref:Uncharacterized protein n=1 Tax=Mesoterricola silvestris TaxID=2927979 RepID=A0AA48K988_9BACT|nr:exodeoxyribonuclease V subunit gamma [Mesoterricola silvestris]BDU73176.1 hypothetical protein METEAL_23500 [Mesoterricola silvestris]